MINRIEIGAPATLLLPGARGVIGGFVHERGGKVFALSASFVIERPVRGAGATSNREAFEPIGMVPVDGDLVPTGLDVLGTCLRGVADSKFLLGQRVRRILGPSRVSSGVVMAIRGHALLRDPRSDRTFGATDLLEVDFSDKSDWNPGPDDAGVLLVDQTDCAVGLLIAGTRARALVAPLDGFLTRCGLDFGAGRVPVGEGETNGIPESRAFSQGLATMVDELDHEDQFKLEDNLEAA
jgi:hypothetical protein